ncbi:sugar phosphate isomerase/epimerase [Lachnospiraceae bacterium ASD3451]|uniref:sugar phosphate isomerase/epimerase family protein n=1 Tax=Diplocloster agilis TaxID=2850323 RepID=UPI001DF0F359|nr:sugar phosphate isomerase/epimerase family protein [Diplocloster agilis]MBU9746805.1 sugar phosphate isomerase/epimerase [Diplocloster agilis]
MKIGLITWELTRPTLDEMFAAAAKTGFEQAQFAFHPWCEGYENDAWGTLPDNFTPELAREAREAADRHGIEIPIVNGFVNLISPDANIRHDALYRLEKLACVCPILGCNKINLCTGSRSHKAMWDRHEENDTQMAWSDICRAIEQVLVIAEHYQVYMGLEVEYTNVINTPEKARRLIDDMGSPWLKVVLDGANLFTRGTAYRKNSADIMKHAFDLLGGDIMMVHGKDIKEGAGLDFTYAGNGIVDFDLMLEELKKLGYHDGIILHGAHSEDQLAPSVAFMKTKLTEKGM